MTRAARHAGGGVVRPPGRILRIAGWVSLMLIGLYVVNAFVLLVHGNAG